MILKDNWKVLCFPEVGHMVLMLFLRVYISMNYNEKNRNI